MVICSQWLIYIYNFKSMMLLINSLSFSSIYYKLLDKSAYIININCILEYDSLSI